jgi:hypothetical protein
MAECRISGFKGSRGEADNTLECESKKAKSGICEAPSMGKNYEF